MAISHFRRRSNLGGLYETDYAYFRHKAKSDMEMRNVMKDLRVFKAPDCKEHEQWEFDVHKRKLHNTFYGITEGETWK